MARLPRLYAPGVVQSVLQQPAAGRTFFADAEDCALFIELLARSARAEAVAVHAYVLLPGEFRLLATPADAGSLGRLMQAIGRRYAPHLNRRSRRSGALWDRRYRSALIDAETLLLPAMRHIERRPVEVGATESLDLWRWSSFAHHAGTAQQPFVADHPAYWALSDTPFARQAAYRDFATAGNAALDERLTRAIVGGWAAGPPAWIASLHEVSNRRASPVGRGRPRKFVLSPNSDGS